jgi:toxin HigB-1
LPHIPFRYKIWPVAIQSFKCRDTEALHLRRRVARFVNIESVARRKLAQLDAAATLEFMRMPPGNQLEGLKGNRAGQHSIRINDQWRVCFVWTRHGPRDVEIVDYH